MYTMHNFARFIARSCDDLTSKSQFIKWFVLLADKQMNETQFRHVFGRILEHKIRVEESKFCRVSKQRSSTATMDLLPYLHFSQFRLSCFASKHIKDISRFIVRQENLVNLPLSPSSRSSSRRPLYLGTSILPCTQNQTHLLRTSRKTRDRRSRL